MAPRNALNHNAPVKQPYRILLTIVAGILLLALGWFLFGPREPSYQGRTLTQWLRAAQGQSPESDSVEARAIRHFGINAIPALLTYNAASRDSTLTKFLVNWRLRHPRFCLPVTSQYDKESLGEIGFALLGAEGRLAVPKLIPLLRENDYAEWTSAARCLASIGPAAAPSVPDLIKVCERENSVGNPSAAAYALGRIGPSAQSAAPALNAGLTNQSPMCGIFSQAALINIHAISISPIIEQLKATNNAQSDAWAVIRLCGTNGRPAVPSLISWLNTRNRDLQANCLSALGSLHLEPDACIPAIVPFLNSKDDRVRWVAIEALRGFGKAARPAVPALLRRFDDTYDEVRKSVTNALREIDPEAAARAAVR